jgi:DnaJ-class molecular chaperone
MSESEYCPDCNGSGEGRHDGSTCQTCKGTGEVSTKENDDAD